MAPTMEVYAADGCQALVSSLIQMASLRDELVDVSLTVPQLLQLSLLPVQAHFLQFQRKRTFINIQATLTGTWKSLVSRVILDISRLSSEERESLESSLTSSTEKLLRRIEERNSKRRSCKMSDSEDAEELFQPSLFINTSYEMEAVEVEDLLIQLYALHRSATTDHDLTGQIVWPAAKLLALYLIQHSDLCQNSSILELGAGTGLAGLVAAKLSNDASKVIMTDNNNLVLELLQRNIDANFASASSKPRYAHLNWGNEEIEEFISHHGSFDVILGADVVFWPTAVPLLFLTVRKLLIHRPSAKFILSYINRSNYTTKLLLTTAEENNLEYEKCNLNGDNLQEIFNANNLDKDKANLMIFTLRQ